jgi:hypothetical protein
VDAQPDKGVIETQRRKVTFAGGAKPAGGAFHSRFYILDQRFIQIFRSEG